MNDNFYEELHNLKHEDEMRPKVLMQGIKRILEEKKEESLLKRWLQRKKKIEPSRWK
ncbi:hypothetical protein [Paenibacillus eucommiae]|uniref:Uncharacterized protein n=1 Tax=Paenibacillus eucommiae TaxID=1355755 RepID=A0ABS4INJ2_9BACL|nr:hypothetical protein [Paenibacillus eucommiae]MBP1989130.1 hypothetical protein [Paenibacillus eucommiae]